MHVVLRYECIQGMHRRETENKETEGYGEHSEVRPINALAEERI